MKKKTHQNRPKKLSVMQKSPPTYEKDFYGWTRLQANLLKNQEFEKMDIDHLIEEIESLGNSEERALESHISNLFMHLLKIKYQPAMHTRSWDNSVKNASFQSEKILKKNPGLKPKLKEITKDAYYSARLKASSETGLETDIFPKKCPFKIAEIIKI